MFLVLLFKKEIKKFNEYFKMAPIYKVVADGFLLGVFKSIWRDFA